MRRLLFILMLPVLMTQQVQTQTGIGGYWHAATVAPDGTPDGAIREFFLELKADGASVSETVAGAPIVIREGRVEGTAVTLAGVIKISRSRLRETYRATKSSSGPWD